MKKIITLVCLLLLAGTAWAVSLIGSGVGGDECADALICQNFEGTGYDNGETWTAEASCDPDYTGTNVLRGDQSLEMSMDGSAPDASIYFPDSGEIWYHERYQATIIGSTTIPLIQFYDNDKTEKVFEVNYGSSLGFGLNCGTNTSYAAYTMTADTEYHFWLHLKATDNTAQLYVGTSNNRPETALIDAPAGDAVKTVVGWLNLHDAAYQEPVDFSYRDQIIIKTSEFTSVKE